MEPSDIPESTTSYEYDPQSFLCEKRTFVFATVSTTILYCLVFFLSLVGNSLVLWVLVKYESLESLTNVFIAVCPGQGPGCSEPHTQVPSSLGGVVQPLPHMWSLYPLAGRFFTS